MAKKKIFTVQHLDSLYKEDISEEDYNNLQPSLKAKYKVIKEKESTEAPAEVKSN